MPKRKRPDDEEYYVNLRTEHVAQGDIFTDVPFLLAMPEPPPPDEPKGVGSRRVLETPLFVQTFGVLLSHTSGFMAQPDGTRGYSHHFRVLAPILPLAMLDEQGLLNEDVLRLLRREDKLLHYMYLPPCVGVWEDERVAALFRPALVHHDVLEGRRVMQMRERAVQQLNAKFVLAFTGQWSDPEQFRPSMGDHWNLVE